VRPFGFNEEEEAEIAEERERSIVQFAHDQLGNSSAQTSEDDDAPQPGSIPVIRSGWAAVEGPSQDLNLSELQWGEPKGATMEEEQEQIQTTDCSLRVSWGVGGEATDARSPWSNTWAQAQEEARQIREMEERFSWMTEADKGMLNLGLEPYPWYQFAEAIENTGETEFMVFEQRGSGKDVLRDDAPDGAELAIGASLIIRSRTCVTAMSVYSNLEDASPATAKLLTLMAECLPMGAQVELIFASEGAIMALGACADILTKGWDIDQYCQEPNWKNLMEVWRAKQIQASCRMEDADGVDLGNLPFLNIALQEVIQTVTEVIRIWQEGPVEFEE
jgi:hypothetical protein